MNFNTKIFYFYQIKNNIHVYTQYVYLYLYS